MEKHYLQFLASGYDRGAVLEELMSEYGNDVWSFAYFLTKRRDAADDIAQEVFLAVYKRMYTFRGESSLKGWILTITRNKALNYLKGSFIRKVVLGTDWQKKKEMEPSSASAEQVALDRETSRHVWEQVMRLPLKHREVVVLAFHYELSMAEIAASLQVSEGTVKSRLHRAKRKMEALLKQSEKEGI
ncbi:RNA polymerase sigma factor [Paenibacillus chungangensis]|uniref:RNA polymerase sigma factor n=1 Tax=Paenibacillus chungangensis TaxID=696535 RepID=A0ABW3HQ68_9BACL